MLLMRPTIAVILTKLMLKLLELFVSYELSVAEGYSKYLNGGVPV